MKIYSIITLAAFHAMAASSCTPDLKKEYGRLAAGADKKEEKRINPRVEITDVLNRLRLSGELPEEDASVFSEGKEVLVYFRQAKSVIGADSSFDAFNVIFTEKGPTIVRHTKSYKEAESWAKQLKGSLWIISVVKNTEFYGIGIGLNSYHLTKDRLITVPSAAGV